MSLVDIVPEGSCANPQGRGEWPLQGRSRKRHEGHEVVAQLDVSLRGPGQRIGWGRPGRAQQFEAHRFGQVRLGIQHVGRNEPLQGGGLQGCLRQAPVHFRPSLRRSRLGEPFGQLDQGLLAPLKRRAALALGLMPSDLWAGG